MTIVKEGVDGEGAVAFSSAKVEPPTNKCLLFEIPFGS